jgi:dienelactone hydrolase
MQLRILQVLPLAVSLFWASATLAEDAWRSIAVRNTFDNQNFTYLERPLAERPGYKILRLKYPSPMTTAVEQNNTVPADYYLPDGIKPGDPKRPAVICLHILDGNDALTDLLCSSLAARGIPAFAFKLPYYGERGLPEGPMAMAKNPKLFAGAIEQSGVDVQRSVDLLASRPEVDPHKIGIAGISLGGIIAASAAGGETRIHKAALMLAGGDVMAIIHHARETKPLNETILAMPAEERTALEAKLAAVDPLKFAPGLRDRAQKGQVLMINAAEDEVIPKKCTEKLADALAIPDKIVWLDGLGHYTAMAELPFALKTMTDFFARDLPPGTTPPSAEKRPIEMKRLAGVMRQAATLLADNPEPGKHHSVELLCTAASGKPPSLESPLKISRDSGDRFSITCKLPLFGDIRLGQNEYPWIVSNGTVLNGTDKPGTALKNPWKNILSSRHQQEIRMLAGLFRALADAPEVMLRFMSVEGDSRPDGRAGIKLVGKEPIAAQLKLIFEREDSMPSEAEFALPDFQCKIRILDAKIDAPSRPDRFDPPADLPVKKVEEKEVYRMFERLYSLIK